MKPVVSIGTQDFEFLRKNNYFLVDKTEFIKEWWENGDAVTLITRPRRFGKTLNLNMLKCFFSKQYTGRSDLFEGLSIWEDESYHELQGSYPVIFLSFADIKGNTFEVVRSSIIQKLVKLFSMHAYVKDERILNEEDWEFLRSVKTDMKDDVAALTINYLSDYMSRYYGEKVLIFLDEYDTPMQEAYVNGYWKELTTFIRSLFNSTFKTNPYLERAVLTGITRVGKESIFSDMNNLEIVTTTSDKYTAAFGFTKEEVFHALKLMGMESDMPRVKDWYDGFIFGGRTVIYNPWSITKFLDSGELGTYWVDTSSNKLISDLIQEGPQR
ncbi:AAA family ATPase [Novisyntrophococcus fermenticellae]|uniref:AAA family ATPase n=1 Tax=Novisyntrophococcus fermenticellae TaxID=2068655 RepID=UPI002E793503|nr:AAA family ATPase [Novisyntrophococcus fermenticellae]